MSTLLGGTRRLLTTTDPRSLPAIVDDRAVITADGAYILATPSQLLELISLGDFDGVTPAALRDRATHTGSQTSSTISDMAERVQDEVAALLAGTSGVTLSYDDEANELTIVGPGEGGGGLDAEAVRDAIGVALLGTGLVSVTVNDAADTITVSTTATANDTDANLKDRANHTGVQAISTVTGLQDALDALLPESLFTAANDILVGTGAATATALNVPASRILARLDSGGLVAATPAQVKTLLAIAQSDVTGLTAALAAIDASQVTTGTIALARLPYAGINAQTGTSYTLQLSDRDKLVTCTNASAITFTVPLNATLAVPSGFSCVIGQGDGGQVTVAFDGTATVKATPTRKLRTNGSMAVLTKGAGDNEWWLGGDLAAS